MGYRKDYESMKDFEGDLYPAVGHIIIELCIDSNVYQCAFGIDIFKLAHTRADSRPQLLLILVALLSADEANQTWPGLFFTLALPPQ